MQKDFFEKTGKMAIGSRLRLLTARMTDEAVEIYRLYGMEFSPKWFPVFFILAEGDPQSITFIARAIGHSQPSVSKMVSEMISAGLVEEVGDRSDKRKTMVTLTEKGRETSEQIQSQYEDVDSAIQRMIDEANYNLWEAIGEWEYLLDQRSLLQRVRDQKKQRESQQVEIIDYKPAYKEVFKALNEEWISAYFEMEEADYKALDHPEDYILKRGGRIFVAIYQNEPVGVCALIKMDDPEYDFELAKMAVSPKAKGKNIGWLLAQAAIRAASDAGASKIFLESNTILKPAISLYHKLGFKKIPGRATPYSRANIQMELVLEK